MMHATTVAEPHDALALRTDAGLKVRLYVMMFLQYFAQGCYLPIVSVYIQDALGFTSQQVGLFGSALACGPLVAPFILGQLVDRHMATERVLAWCHLISGPLMIMLYFQTGVVPVFILGTLYSILYVPSMMLTNSLAFYHLKNRDREFPLVRLWGTVGYVVPAWIIEMWWLRGLRGDELNHARGFAFLLAGLAGVVLGLYSLTLPRTPPQKRDDRTFAPGKVMKMLTQRHFLVLVVVTFFISMAHKYHFVWNSPFLKSLLASGDVGEAWEQRISSLGQIGEVFVMAGLGAMLMRLGFKRTMLIGCAAYMVRCLIFAAVADWDLPFALAMTLTCVGEVMHGLCFGCFMAAAFIYVDRVSPPDVRGSMQNLYGTFVMGLGMVVAGAVSGQVAQRLLPPAQTRVLGDWTDMWLVGAALTAACVVVFAIGFPRTPVTRPATGAAT